MKNAIYEYIEQKYENGFEDKSLSEILEYIEDVRKKYPDYKLFPAFYIAE